MRVYSLNWSVISIDITLSASTVSFHIFSRFFVHYNCAFKCTSFNKIYFDFIQIYKSVGVSRISWHVCAILRDWLNTPLNYLQFYRWMNPRLYNCFVFLSVFIKQMEVSWKQRPDRRRIGILLHCFPIVNTMCLLCQHVWTDMLIARVPRSFVSSYRDEELSIPPTRPVEENHENTSVYCTREHVTSLGSLHEIPSVWLKISQH